MNITINAVCYKSKTLKTGKHPIMLRIYQRGKLKYLSLGLSIHAKDWDFKNNAPKSSHSDREYIQKIILDKIVEYQTQVLNFRANKKSFTATTLIESTSCNRAETTMSLLFRTLRSAYNKAIEQQVVKREAYPFNEFRMSKFSSKTKKRSITKEEVKRILILDLTIRARAFNIKS